ncbi:MerR family DNA-binding transcriptional regulator [Streptomyces sp. NEAU-YJ-81]|nr:MerR family DNA-binding transcriptional regulator [Streptomyces sp. NEAU-YJ-81]
MRIGEAAQRTGTTARLLRYYEQQGLIVPGRSENGYREYDENALGRILQIRRRSTSSSTCRRTASTSSTACRLAGVSASHCRRRAPCPGSLTAGSRSGAAR